jgi:hypothetical protein
VDVHGEKFVAALKTIAAGNQLLTARLRRHDFAGAGFHFLTKYPL